MTKCKNRKPRPWQYIYRSVDGQMVYLETRRGGRATICYHSFLRATGVRLERGSAAKVRFSRVDVR